MIETWLVVALLAVLAISLGAAGYYLYRRSRRIPAAVLPAEPEAAPAAAPLGYTAGGGSYMITLGIGVPAEIAAFILFGLAANPGGAPPVTAGGRPHRHLHIRMRMYV